ncbi:Alpha/Beta hydrolase protein [Panaeolus papilionaceus]|nr:Alpha/Beta hydrolase protein [Panaeolus papilionaceus]
MSPFRSLFTILSVALLAVVQALAAQNQLQEVTSFGTNPTRVRMFTYRPTGLVAKPALIVAIHYCTGTAQAYFSGTQYANLADSYKNFMVIYPHAPDSGGCWDVHTTETLTHDRGGDSLGIASMVRYAISTYNVDPARVFATGTSSGGMMSQVLAGAYPDLFAAISAWCGVPYGCFAGPSMWNSQCSTGQLSKTPQAWGDQVRSGYPGYTGNRPRMQIWHGRSDTTLSYNNHLEAIKQWANVFGVSQTPTTALTNTPISGWNRSRYGTKFEAIDAPVGHDIQVQANEVLGWFELNSTPDPRPTTTPPATTGSTISTSPPVSTTTTASGPEQTRWGQCGGIGYNGPTVCQSPYTCKYSNDWYSQVCVDFWSLFVSTFLTQ